MATPGPAGAPTEEENPRIALLRTCRRSTKLSVLPIFWGEEWAATCRVPRVYGTVMQRRDNGTKLRVNWSVDGETQTNDITELADPDFDVMVHDEPMRRRPSAARRRRAPDQAGVEDGETADEMEYSEERKATTRSWRRSWSWAMPRTPPSRTTWSGRASDGERGRGTRRIAHIAALAGGSRGQRQRGHSRHRPRRRPCQRTRPAPPQPRWAHV